MQRRRRCPRRRRARRNASDEKTNEHRIKAEIAFEKPNPIVDRIPAKQPRDGKGKGRPLPDQGAR